MSATYGHVIKTAADYAEVDISDMHALTISLDGTDYEIGFHTDYMSYIMYIDFSGMVLGFFSEPMFEHLTPEEELVMRLHCA